MKTIHDIVVDSRPVEAVVRELQGDGIDLQALLSGDFDRRAISDTIAGNVDLTAFGVGELGGRILVLEPDVRRVGKDRRPVRIYFVLEEDSFDIDVTSGEKRFYDTREIQELLPFDLTRIHFDPEQGPIVRKGHQKPKPRDPNPSDPLQPGRPVALHRKAQFDPLLYRFLYSKGEDVSHLIYGLDDIPEDKRAIEGPDALRKKVPNAEYLLAIGVTKIHSLESWLHEMVDDRMKRLKVQIREFYATDAGKQFVRDFQAQHFTLSYDAAPDVVWWTVKNAAPERDARFLLSAIGAGLVDDGTGAKSIYSFWSRVARSAVQASMNKWLVDEGHLEHMVTMDELYIPMLRAYRSRPGIYSGATVESSLLGLWGMNRVQRADGHRLGAMNLNKDFVEPGRYFLNNYRALNSVVNEALGLPGTEVLRKKSKTTPGFVGRVILEHDDLHTQLQQYATVDGRLTRVPITPHLLQEVLPVYFRVEVDTYRDRMTLPHDKQFHLKNSK